MVDIKSTSGTKLKRVKDETVLTNVSKNLNGIDFMKFFCCFFVVIGHVPLIQGNVSELGESINFWTRNYLCRIVVPFYFVCSGFFLFRKMSFDNLNIDAIKNYCFKILRLNGIWHILLFVGGTVHLWYLGSIVSAVILLSLCFYFRMNKKLIVVLACVLYAIGLLGDSYFGILAPLKNIGIFRSLLDGYALAAGTTRNGIFMGFIFVLMGAVLSHQEQKMKPLPAAVGFLLSMGCLYVEAYLLRSHDIPLDYNMYVFSLPAAYFLFSFLCVIPLQDRAIYRHLRNVGMFVYFLHLFVHKFASLATGIFDGCFGTSIQNYQLAVTLCSTLIIAVFLEWLSAKKAFKWIHWTLG